MTGESDEVSGLIRRAAGGEEEPLRELFSRHRDRLKRMVHLRLSRRLAGRVDDSDVVQEAFVEAARRLGEYAQAPGLPLYLWLRHLTALKLAEVHQQDLTHTGDLLGTLRYMPPEAFEGPHPAP